jgi:hypothetical protein
MTKSLLPSETAALLHGRRVQELSSAMAGLATLGPSHRDRSKVVRRQGSNRERRVAVGTAVTRSSSDHIQGDFAVPSAI